MTNVFFSERRGTERKIFNAIENEWDEKLTFNELMLETTSLIHFVKQNKTFMEVLTSNYDISVYPTFYSKRQKHTNKTF